MPCFQLKHGSLHTARHLCPSTAHALCSLRNLGLLYSVLGCPLKPDAPWALQLLGPAEQPSWRHWGAGGGEGALQVSWEGQICPYPIPSSPFIRTGPHGSPQRRVLPHPAEIPAPGQRWPFKLSLNPRRSHHH